MTVAKDYTRGTVLEHLEAQDPGAAMRPVESERYVVGAALTGDDGVANLVLDLSPSDFTDAALRRAWEVIQKHVRLQRQVDPDLIYADLKGEAAVETSGGLAFLRRLADNAQTWAAAGHVDTIRDRAMRRRVRDLASETREAVQVDLDRTGLDHLAELERAVGAVLAHSAPDDASIVDAQAAADEALDKMDAEAAHGKPRGLLTGLRSFDYRCRGLQPGKLIVLAGRPSMGKTALARATANSAAERNPDRLFVYFAMEMDREELSHRTLSQLSWRDGPVSALPFFDMTGILGADERRYLRSLKARIPKNFKIEDTSSLSVAHIRRRLYALKRKHRLGAVFIDYLQLMEKPDAKGRNEASVIGEMTKALKQLARDLGICIVLLSQLNRTVEHRDNKRPQMSDLLDSGKIEADADTIMLCFREFYYLEKEEPDPLSVEHRDWLQKIEEVRRKMDVFIPKNRGGPTGREAQVYFAEYDHIEDQPQSPTALGGVQ